MSTCRFLYHDGLILRSSEAPPVATFLESHTGAYTTTRTINNATNLLFWKRHLRRLAGSVRVLLNSKPELLFKSGLSQFSMTRPFSDSSFHSLVNDSMSEALKLVLQESDRNFGEELAVTVLVSGNREKLSIIDDNSGHNQRALDFLDVWLHIGLYTASPFGVQHNAARLALVGHGRDVATAKYSDWVRLRKPLERLRPPSATELLLSNDGDHLLEGCITNFFIVCCKEVSEKSDHGSRKSCQFEVQTAPITDGVLPGVIRELVIEVCLSKGIPVREIAPSWSEHEHWEEAFISSSLRVLQHVERIAVPIGSWEMLASKRPEEIPWKEKRFQEGPGIITQLIQKEIMVKANREGCPLSCF